MPIQVLCKYAVHFQRDQFLSVYGPTASTRLYMQHCTTVVFWVLPRPTQHDICMIYINDLRVQLQIQQGYIYM